MGGTTTISVGSDGLAIITIINPPVNSLNCDVLSSLIERIDEASKRDDVKAVVITGEKDNFSGGYDMNAIDELQEGKAGPELISTLSNLMETAIKPFVAAINGPAIGAGFEVAMACKVRIATPTAQLRLPELMLGLIPGGGGTQRLPRLVGIPKALEILLTSKIVHGEEAHKLGLVDAIVPRDELLEHARQRALDILASGKPLVSSLNKTDKIEPLGKAREILNNARAQARIQAPNLQHPQVCIDVFEEGIFSGPRAGLSKEREAFQILLKSDTCKSLVHVYFAQGDSKKIPGITDLGLKPMHIEKVAILGGGLMGSGIATALILNGYLVVLKEVDQKLLDAGIGRVIANLTSSVKKGKLTQETFEKTISRLKGVLDYESFKDVDMVIEAVTENVSLKQRIFLDLEKYCSPNCILASNTSTVDLNLLGDDIKSLDRIIGTHFFSPAQVTPLLEIIRTSKTSPQTVVDLLNVAKKINKTPVVVGNCTGVAVNWMFFPYTQAALLLVERGADVYNIDRAITEFGMPMGPFRLCDHVGFGVAVATGSQFVYNSMLIPLMQEDNRAGETTRKGFYVYSDEGKSSPDPEIKKYINKAREISGISLEPKFGKLSDKDIIEMVFFPVVNEACRVYAKGIAVKAADLDIASVMGMRFPPYRGGIMFWGDSVGSNYIFDKLNEWSKLYGEFFKPCDYLAQRAALRAPLSSPLYQAKSRL